VITRTNTTFDSFRFFAVLARNIKISMTTKNGGFSLIERVILSAGAK
jgi:hypothetical protein